MNFKLPGFQPSRPMVQLPKVSPSSGSELAEKFKASPEAKSVLKPGMSSSEYVHALEQKKQSLDAVKALAHGMPERHSVWWACQSSQKVAGKLNPQEQAATKAAETWVKNPTEENRLAASAAAAKTDFKGPGGWAAQAAAWSKPAAPAAKPVSAAAPSTGAPSLTAPAVSGAVLLAAGLSKAPAMSAPQKPNLQMPKIAAPTMPQAPAMAAPQMPAVDQSKLAGPLQPFIDLGKDVASGKNAWA